MAETNTTNNEGATYQPINPGYRFMNGPWENSELPTITRVSPYGGDPQILCTISKVHRPDDIHDLCASANKAWELAREATARGDVNADLLKALREILAIAEDFVPAPLDAPGFKRARAAISKALGQGGRDVTYVEALVKEAREINVHDVMNRLNPLTVLKLIDRLADALEGLTSPKGGAK